MLGLVKFYHSIICKISSPLPHCLMDEKAPCTSWDLHDFQIVWLGWRLGLGQAGRLSPNYPRLQFALAICSHRVTLEVPHFVSGRKWVWFSFSWEKANKQLSTLSFSFEMVPSYPRVRKKRQWLSDRMLTFDLEKSVQIRLPLRLFFFSTRPL